ncbi:MAG TPA: hypothetical protein PLV50_04185 [Smithella sp.]|nr:hypothetical protein [Smithella sp.]
MTELENQEMHHEMKATEAVEPPGVPPAGKSFFITFSEKLSSSVMLKWLIIALLPLLVLFRYPVDRIDYDLWWQMAHGKYYLTHHTLRMDLSVFSWTPTDPTWLYNTCLGSIVVYLFYSFMGGFGLWLFQWLIFGGIFLSFFLFLRLMNQRLDVSSATMIAAIAIACSISCRYYKPELFSALLFSWTLFLFFYVKIKRKKYLFYIYPFLFALWVNLHGAFIMGLAFLGMAFVGELLNKFFFARESFTVSELIHLAVAGILSGAATLFNPYGIDYLISLFPIAMNALGYQSYSSPYDKMVLAYVSLWNYLKTIDVNIMNAGMTAWLMTLMLLSVLIFSAYELFKKRTMDFTLLIASIALYWKGMDTSRASYFFPVAFFFIFFYLTFFRLKLVQFDSRAIVFSLSAFVLFIIVIAFFNIRYTADNKWFGQGLDNFVPVKEVEFLKKYKLEGPIFNDYVIGGYLLWKLYPDYKVFIDPRGGLYRNQVFPDYMDFTMKRVNLDDINRFREKYPFKVAVLHYRQMALIVDFLRAGDEWRLLYFEKNAAILIHKSLMNIVSTEAGNVNLSPVRFAKVKNPEILMNVFNFYNHLNPEAGRYIHNIFKKNISDYYIFKQPVLTAMEIDIQKKQKQLEEKKKWLAP